MWKKVLDYGQQIFFLAQDVLKLKRQVDNIEKELAELKAFVRDLARQIEFDREMARKDQEILVLRLQHQLEGSKNDCPRREIRFFL